VDNLDTAKKALNKVKIKLMSRADSIFFTTVFFSLIHKWDDTIPTAKTNGKCVNFNPTFFLSLTPGEQLFLVLHETMHVAFMHMLRLSDRQPEKWNKAADYVINHFLVETGLPMPKGGLYDAQYADMSTEQVYALLPDEPEQEGGGSGGYTMDLEPGDGTPDEVKEELDSIIIRASVQAQMQGGIGKLPGEVEVLLQNLVSPKLPWHRILRTYFNKMVKSDYSFRKPNRRYFPDYIIPSQHSEALGDIAVAIDTSGSVTDEEFTHFISEVRGMMKQMRPEKLTLLQFDTEIKSETTLYNESDLERVEFVGRGGTRIGPVIEWAAANKPNVMLIFTDGFFRHVEENPKVPIIWVIHSNKGFTAHYGKTIEYEFTGDP
jgi:Schitoviridae HNH endonuclease